MRLPVKLGPGLLAILCLLPSHRALQATPFVRGDADTNGNIDITDAIRIFGFLFLGDPLSLDCDDAADANDSGVLDLSDGIHLLSFLFTGGPAPPVPYPGCGDDPSPDDLECSSFPHCRENRPPAASFTATALSGEVPLEVTFDASGSSDPDGADDLADYRWNFGDGKSGSGVRASHTYSSGGSFEVVLTVLDRAGATGTARRTISAESPSVIIEVSPTRAAVTRTQPQQFTATVTGNRNTSVTWSVDGTTGGNATSGSVSAGGLYTPSSSTNPGTHTVTATSVVNNTRGASATIAVTDLAGVFTWRGDAGHTGQDRQEYALSPSSVNSQTFAKLFSCTVDGKVYAQPLYVANLVISGGTHNVIFVATEHDSVYALDADANPSIEYWKTSFLSAGVRSIRSADRLRARLGTGRFAIPGPSGRARLRTARGSPCLTPPCSASGRRRSFGIGS